MRHGWYQIAGVQTGDRTLEQQITGLEELDVRGHDVLELGCAEGLMSRWMVQERGAAHVTGVDSVLDHIREARKQCEGHPIQLVVHNLNTPRPFGGYDTVMALAVLHKLRRPDHMAAQIAQLARKQIVLRLPPQTAPVVIDERSGNKPYDIEFPLLQRGWKRVRVTKGSFEEWTAFYAR